MACGLFDELSLGIMCAMDGLQICTDESVEVMLLKGVRIWGVVYDQVTERVTDYIRISRSLKRTK